jgi:hypothetical protein
MVKKAEEEVNVETAEDAESAEKRRGRVHTEGTEVGAPFDFAQGRQRAPRRKSRSLRSGPAKIAGPPVGMTFFKAGPGDLGLETWNKRGLCGGVSLL